MTQPQASPTRHGALGSQLHSPARQPATGAIPAGARVFRQRSATQIRAARLQANLTQEAMANRIPMDRATYVRNEQGHAAALLDTLILIADAIGVSLRSWCGSPDGAVVGVTSLR
ncbi:helix-turn-helix transcriptional regulator [Streptomyces zaomyceticus]|uniref:helix-turn-helix transcriptional regulator n=1 Tax=Streptomyces zaomyceticus TaxID=68286 RepID=UPI00386343A4